MVYMGSSRFGATLMKIQNIFYLLGFFAILKGVLVLIGFSLPRRDGTIIYNIVGYGEKSILFGISIILITFFIVNYFSDNKKIK